MKNVMMFVLVLVSVFAASAQDTPKNELHGYVEFETDVVDGKATPQVKTYVTYGGKGKVGMYCWAQNSKNYNQVYCGPTLKVKPWLEVGVAAGVQTGAKRLQLAASVWAGTSIGKKFVSNLFLIEKGGLWYRNVTSVSLNERVTVSLASQRYRGTGPRADVKLTKQLSAGAELNFSKRTAFMFGLKYSF